MRPGSSSDAWRVSSSSSRTIVAIRSSFAGWVIASCSGSWPPRCSLAGTAGVTGA